MKYVGFICVDAKEIIRSDWWDLAGVPAYNRKGNRDDHGYMWRNADGSYEWALKDTFERQFKKCL